MKKECAYCYSTGRHDPGCPALTVADLRKRIRLARKELHDEGAEWPSHGAILRAWLALDLRKPLKARGWK